MNEIVAFSSDRDVDQMYAMIMSGQAYYFGIVLGIIVNSFWDLYIQKNTDYFVNKTSSIDFLTEKLCEHIKPAGYITANIDDIVEVGNDLSLDSRFILIAFDERQEKLLQNKDIPKIELVKTLSYNGDVLILKNPKIKFSLIDYAIANRALMTWNKYTLGKHTHLNSGCKVYGWSDNLSLFGQEVPLEGIIVNELSKIGCVIYAADFQKNLHIYQKIDLDVKFEKPIFEKGINSTHHLIAFIISDGDNINVMSRLSDETRKPKDIPVGWTINPSAPKIYLKKIRDNLDPRDSFIAGPSGYGYVYPNNVPNKDYYKSETERVMKEINITLLNQINHSMQGFFNFLQELIFNKQTPWDPFPEFVPIDAEGIIVYNYFTYDMGHGKSMYVNNPTLDHKYNKKIPILTGTKKLYFESEYNQVLNRKYKEGGMTLIPVNFWSFSLQDITVLVNDIIKKYPYVKVVNPHQYFEEYKKRNPAS